MGYQNLLGDIKGLIINNEKLKSMVLDLEGKVDDHNKQVLSNDGNIKAQIELLTKNTLSKKTIEWMAQKEIIVKATKEMEALNTKVKRMEMTQFNSSSLMDSVTGDMNSFATENKSIGMSTGNSMHSQMIASWTGEIKDHGYGNVVRSEIVQGSADVVQGEKSSSTDKPMFVTMSANGKPQTSSSTTNNQGENVSFTTTTSTRGDTVTNNTVNNNNNNNSK